MPVKSGYSYWKEVAVTHTDDGAQTNYQMKVLVGESSGATGEEVDCGGHCLSTFNDLFFQGYSDIDQDEVVDLDYWIESISGATPNQLATVWVELKYIPAHPNNTVMWMSYGKVGASAASNGANTFILFEDFNDLSDGDINGQNGWTGSAEADVETGTKYEGAKALQITGADKQAYKSISISSYHVFVEWYSQVSAAEASKFNCELYLKEGASFITSVSMVSNKFQHLIASTWEDLGTNWSGATWYKVKLALDSTSTHKVWINDALQTPAHSTNFTNVSTAVDTLRLGHYDGTKTGYFDRVVVGNFTANPPTWGAWGAEQQIPIYTPYYPHILAH